MRSGVALAAAALLTMCVVAPRAANIATESHVLAYGRTWRYRGFACRSRRVGLTCRNRRGHGFFLSRERRRIF